MCGINGFNFASEDLICRMNKRIAHRGPDDSGFFVAPGISLGNQRLSIIDLSALGHQPMQTADGRYVIVYNGELYNFRELRVDLEARGVKFRSHADTEVVLYAFAEYGVACFERFNGIYAFAIWDNREQSLFLARDPMGVKPLYYYVDGRTFIFSSEAKAMFEHRISATFDVDALNAFLRFLYVPSPATMWKEIRKLPPGYYATLHGTSFSMTPYRVFREASETAMFHSYDEAKEAVREGFRASVRRQLVSDKPIGVFLSGGIDSTAVLGAMSHMGSRRIKTFSIGFASAAENEKYNVDFNLARQSARHFGADHHELIMTDADAADVFERVVYHMDEPLGNPIASATFLLSAFAKQSVDVVFGGDGGDELFGGYDRYWYSDVLDRVQRLPAVLWQGFLPKMMGRILGKPAFPEKIQSMRGLPRYIAFMAQKEDRIAEFLNPAYNRPDQAAHVFAPYVKDAWSDFTNQFMAIDSATWLPDESLLRSDKMTMAHGLEERVPILDIELADLAQRIPSRFKLDRRVQGKRVFRDAVADFLPTFIARERKRGWFSPASKWLRAELYALARAALSPSYCVATKELFDFTAVQKIFNDHVEGRRYALNTIWSIFAFQVWYRTFIQSPTPSRTL